MLCGKGEGDGGAHIESDDVGGIHPQRVQKLYLIARLVLRVEARSCAFGVAETAQIRRHHLVAAGHQVRLSLPPELLRVRKAVQQQNRVAAAGAPNAHPDAVDLMGFHE